MTEDHPLRGALARALGSADPLPVDPDIGPSGAWAVLAAVLAGGFLGTVARYELEIAWPARPGHFPVATFVINTSGALLLGVILAAVVERRRPGRLLRPFAATGLLGGWTTYSTFAVETVTLAKHSDLVAAAAYLGLTLASGVTAVAVGIAVGRSRR